MKVKTQECLGPWKSKLNNNFSFRHNKKLYASAKVSPSKHKTQLAVGTSQFLETPGQQGNTSSETHLPQPDTGYSLNINRADWRATGI